MNKGSKLKNRNHVIILDDVVIKTEFLKKTPTKVVNGKSVKIVPKINSGILHYYLDSQKRGLDNIFNAKILNINLVKINTDLMEFSVTMKRYETSMWHFFRLTFSNYNIVGMKNCKKHVRRCQYVLSKYLLYIIANGLRGRFDIDYKLPNVVVDMSENRLDIKIIDKEFEINGYGLSAVSSVSVVKKPVRKYIVSKISDVNIYTLRLKTMLNEVVVEGHNLLYKCFLNTYKQIDYVSKLSYTEDTTLTNYISILLNYCKEIEAENKYDKLQTQFLEHVLTQDSITALNKLNFTKLSFNEVMEEFYQRHKNHEHLEALMTYTAYVVHRHMYLHSNQYKYEYTMLDGNIFEYNPEILEHLVPIHDYLKKNFNTLNETIIEIIYMKRECETIAY